MGGLYKMMPATYLMMWVGTLALIGFPGFSGFFSKDMIIESAYAAHSSAGNYAFMMGVLAAFMTAFYSLRLMFMTFHGTSRADKSVLDHVHESPKVILIPLALLALGAAFAGYAFKDYFVGAGYEHFWGEALFLSGENVMEAAEHIPDWVRHMPLIMLLAGGALAWLFYIRRPDIPKALATMHEPLYKFLLNKWYFDELYDLVFVRSAKWLGYQLWKKGDGGVIDRFGPDGVSGMVLKLAQRARQIQTGYVYHYAFAMLIGVTGFVSWYMLSGEGTLG
jgi:NADH-quinone oxidoreductase subunit L